MNILNVLLVVALIGAVCWLLVSVIPMPEPFPKIMIAIAVILTLLWVLHNVPLRLP